MVKYFEFKVKGASGQVRFWAINFDSILERNFAKILELMRKKGKKVLSGAAAARRRKSVMDKKSITLSITSYPPGAARRLTRKGITVRRQRIRFVRL